MVAGSSGMIPVASSGVVPAAPGCVPVHEWPWCRSRSSASRGPVSQPRISDDVELVLDARAAVGEGAVWDETGGQLVWVDIPVGLVHRLDPASGRDESIDVGQPVGAIVLREAGGYVLALRDGFALLDPTGPEIRVVREVEARDPRTRMNDGRCDSAGRFWAGTMALDMRSGAGSLYRLDRDLSAVKLLDRLTVPNGIAWSPDDRTMYLVDSGEHCVDAFDFNAEAGTIDHRRRLIEIPQQDGLPDGMSIDVDGCLWIALWGGWAVRCYEPDGRLRRRVDLPVARVTSCAFGGENLNELYVTSAGEGLTTDQRARQPHAGGVFRLRPGTQGPVARRFGG